ncbi:MAG: hypothetical protein ABR549_13250 [Mycobacteriales bacterium]
MGRHRVHRFPARTNRVKVMYVDDELAVVREAAHEVGLRLSGYVAASALAAAEGNARPGGRGKDRLLLAELIQLRIGLRQHVTGQVQGAQERDDLGEWFPGRGEDDQRPAGGVGAVVREPEGALLDLDEGMDAGAELVVVLGEVQGGDLVGRQREARRPEGRLGPARPRVA